MLGRSSGLPPAPPTANQAELTLSVFGGSFCKYLGESMGFVRVCVRLEVSARGCAGVSAHGAQGMGGRHCPGSTHSPWLGETNAIVCPQAYTCLSASAFVPLTHAGLYVRDYLGFRRIRQPFHLSPSWDSYKGSVQGSPS